MTTLGELVGLLGSLRAETQTKISELLPSSERRQKAAATSIEEITKGFGVDPDTVFGRLYYYLEKKHGYRQNDGSAVHLFALAVGGDRNCINFPYAESILAELREKSRG